MMLIDNLYSILIFFFGNSTNQCSMRPCSMYMYCTVICRSVHFSAGTRADVPYYHKSNYTSKKFKMTRIESLATLTAESSNDYWRER